jgi:DUF1009 family protein
MTNGNLSTTTVPEAVILIAGKGAYPVEIAQSARSQGVKHLVVLAFKGETERSLAKWADDIIWLHLGRLNDLLSAVQATGITQAVMAGQITPSSLFSVRFDSRTLDLLKRLPVKNAETIFGAIGEELRQVGVDLLPAWLFMKPAMPAAGLLTRRVPSAAEKNDIAIGIRAAKTTSGLDIGQTVTVKDGVILAVEAFEGTNAAIKRGGELGGPGMVVVKVAKLNHDVRFDIPVIGLRTLECMRKVKASVLAVEAGRTILLEREKLIRTADDWSISIEAVDAGHEQFG